MQPAPGCLCRSGCWDSKVEFSTKWHWNEPNLPTKPKDGVSNLLLGRQEVALPNFLAVMPAPAERLTSQISMFFRDRQLWWALWIELLIHWKTQEKLGKNKSRQFKLLAHFCVGEWNVKCVLKRCNNLVAYTDEWISDLMLSMLE